MDDTQIALFRTPPALAPALRETLALTAPRAPGVYIMTGRGEVPLYIGQSGNLRARLGFYRNARAGNAPAKIIRLLSRVIAVSWEVCDCPESARLRENELLRLHRPRFNRMNVYPRAHQFISFSSEADELVLERSALPCGEQSFGAYKADTAGALAALARLLYAWVGEAGCVHDLPAGAFRSPSPRRFRIPIEEPHREWLVPRLTAFLMGESDALLAELHRVLDAQTGRQTFLVQSQISDLDLLASFFRSGPARTRALLLREGGSGSEELLYGEEIDDLFVSATRSQPDACAPSSRPGPA